MDDSFRSSNGLHGQPYPAAHGSPHTLPPLNQQSHFGSIFNPSSNSAPQTPLPQYVPGTSASSGSVPSLRPLQPSYGMQSFSAAQSGVNIYPTTSTHGGPAPIAPAPLPGTMQELRPMPQGGLGLPHSYTPQLLSQQHALTNPEPEPIHVVGQQGRRGVLPTTPGRMAPTSAKQPINPTKNEENKFECPSCNKTYLHLKHLKRHLLRHTGERPYQCHLCKDTFSRSDILKRHFQKCSIRRGNPTGANHLAHSQAHLRKNRLATGVSTDQSFIPPLATSMGYSSAFVPPVAAMNGMPMPADNSPYANGGVQSMSARTSRSNSLIRPSLHENRRSLSSLELGATRPPFDVGGDFRVPTSMAGTVDHGVAQFAAPQHQTSQVQNSFGYNPNANHSELNGDFVDKSESSNASQYARGGDGNLQGISSGQDSGLDWPPPFNANGQPSYLPTSANSEPPSIKSDPNNYNSDFHAPNDTSDAMFSSLYSGVGSFGESNADFESWLAQNSSLSPLQLKVDSLVTFCFPDEQQTDPKNPQFLKNILTVENVQHFVKLYGNFNSHWPLLHLSTFNIDNTSNGLLMTMVCVGAVYSDRIAQDTVRWLTGVVRSAVYRSSRFFALSDQNITSSDNPQMDSEELQTLILLEVLHVWHGTPETRQLAREQLHPKLVAVAKGLHLLQTFGYENPQSSFLHEPGPLPDTQTVQNSWMWEKWVEQEKRVRGFYIVLLLDAAFVIFFNAQPSFNIRDIRLPLPADDAVWEARTSEECANALGLYGTQMQSKNAAGSRQPKQMQMSDAFKMMQSTQDFPRGYTNVYSKFILIHALHIQIWYIHRLFLHPQQTPAGSQMQPIMAFPSTGSGASTPISQNDWMASDGSTTGTMSSATNSGRATPIDGSMPSPNAYSPQLQHDLRALRISLDKWKRMWDSDLALQYPAPNTRTGFCRDGIHFYHLANYLLRAKPSEWQLQPEQRMQHAFHLLNQIKSRVASEQDYKGLDRGSVTEMDDGYATTTKIEYGIEKLTLDMKGLFAPTIADQNGQSSEPS